MNVLSLFDGMSCGQIALRELGISVTRYYASEIDKFAIAQTQLNFPDTVQLGDVERWKDWEIDWASIDLIIGGSPCQGFSFAGKQLAFDDPRSRLFFVFVDILNHVRVHNPNVRFLLENVIMKKEHIRVITKFLGIHPTLINSALVSAQNRKRLYWSNIKKIEGLFGEVYTDIPQPKDRGIVIRDILEKNVDEKYYIKADLYGQSVFGKCRTIRTGGRSSTTERHCWDVIKLDKTLKPKGNQNKASCLTAGGHSGGNHSDMDLFFIKQRPRGENKGGVFYKKAPTLTSCSYEQNNLLCSKSIRRLTPTECARLQTIPDWYKWLCSDTQQYKMLGNGWTVEVIKHIFSFYEYKRW